ncbi:MAG: ATP-binding protein [Candidatus Promineifilaceae bacterium]
MLNSLRSRLIISHLLPPLIIIPLMGVILVYAVESRILIPSLTRELKGDASLVAEILRNEPATWQDQKSAEAALSHLSTTSGDRVMLLDSDERLLASTDSADAALIGTASEIVERLNPEQSNEIVSTADFNPRLGREAIDVLVPVRDSDQRLLGWVRITYLYNTVFEQLFQFRFLLGATLFVALLAGLGIGYVLALNVSTPIQNVADAIYDLATGDQHDPLPVIGPKEIRLQVQAVNFLVGRLDSLEKARRQLLANLVHEIGRPLGAIHSGLQALLRGGKEDEALLDDLLVGMDDQVERLHILLDDLAHLHGQVLGTLELNRQPIALSQWLHQTLTPWLAPARDKKQLYELSIPADLPTIPADPTRLGQALDNLVNNAIKYTPMGRKIFVSAGVKGDEVWIRVSDDGPGILADEQAHVFEPFFRGNQKQRDKQGMGLGLSIARDLIAAHSGRLELESQPGKGSQFTIWLPMTIPTLEEINLRPR